MSVSLPSSVIQRLMKELRLIHQQPLEGITVSINDDNLSCIYADIEGPVETPFEGGIFRIKLQLSSDFPASPPKGHFVTKIFHPNVSSTGEICVNTLKKDWKPSHGIKHVLMVIRCLLIVPNPESALNEDAGKLLLENYSDYSARAQLYTKIHAKPKNSSNDTNKSAETNSTTSTNTNSNNSEENQENSNSRNNMQAAAPAATAAAVNDNSLAKPPHSATEHTAKLASTSADLAAAKAKLAVKKKSLKRL
jgi:ubiquitin-conjugating enzyme E2 S